MDDLISRQAAKLAIVEKGQASKRYKIGEFWELNRNEIWDALDGVPSAQTEIIRCKDCRWWDKYNEKHGYCMAAKHGFMSSHWEISIYRTYGEDFFCADAEPKEKEGGDDE